MKYNKNIYAYDDLFRYSDLCTKIKDNGAKVYYQHLTADMVDNSIHNKMYHLSTPVLMVAGTSSKQGKFYVQQILRDSLEKKYKVGWFASEPNGFLLGADEVFSFGYGYDNHLKQRECIHIINKMIHNIEISKEYDIILTGLQSQTVAYSTGNLDCYPLEQSNFIIGTEPDAFVLCVNLNDEISYIKKTIAYLESFTYGKVIAIVMFPFFTQNKISMVRNKYSMAKDEYIKKKRQELSDELNMQVLVPSLYEEDKKTLVTKIEKFFA